MHCGIITLDIVLRLLKSQSTLPNDNFTSKTFSEEAYFGMIYDMTKNVETKKVDDNRR